MEKTITVKIDPLGNPSIEAHEFKGQSCAEATKAIEVALAGGDGQMTREFKPEWHETEQTVQEQEIGW